MTTTTATQASLLTGVHTLGLFTDQSPQYRKFAKAYKSELQLAVSVYEGLVTLSEAGEHRINQLWKILLKDHLGLEDEGFKDMNGLAIASFERGAARGKFVF